MLRLDPFGIASAFKGYRAGLNGCYPHDGAGLNFPATTRENLLGNLGGRLAEVPKCCKLDFGDSLEPSAESLAKRPRTVSLLPHFPRIVNIFF